MDGVASQPRGGHQRRSQFTCDENSERTGMTPDQADDDDGDRSTHHQEAQLKFANNTSQLAQGVSSAAARLCPTQQHQHGRSTASGEQPTAHTPTCAQKSICQTPRMPPTTIASRKASLTRRTSRPSSVAGASAAMVGGCEAGSARHPRTAWRRAPCR